MLGCCGRLLLLLLLLELLLLLLQLLDLLLLLALLLLPLFFSCWVEPIWLLQIRVVKELPELTTCGTTEAPAAVVSDC